MSRTTEAPPARVCVLTPEARGAVAVVRVWGPGAVKVADGVFRSARGVRLSDSPTDRPVFGRAGAGAGDEVVAVVVGGEPLQVEIHCHGGPEPVALVAEALVAAGAERRQPIAWVRHDAPTLGAAEAFVELARAPTLRTAEILLEQSQGALEHEVAELARLVDADRPGAIHGVERLLARGGVGLKIITGWSVALAGRPNVGKSRLLNALAGYERAIVDPSPGTTRDVVTVRTAFDGWPVELADTAGLRDAADATERAGIALARVRHAEADLTLLILDRSEPLTLLDHLLRKTALASGGMVVASKSDLPAAWEPEDDAVLTVSAVNGEGLERLASAVALRLVPDPPPPGAGVPFRPAHARRLDSALQALRADDSEAAVACLSGWGTV